MNLIRLKKTAAILVQDQWEHGVGIRVFPDGTPKPYPVETLGTVQLIESDGRLVLRAWKQGENTELSPSIQIILAHQI